MSALYGSLNVGSKSWGYGPAFSEANNFGCHGGTVAYDRFNLGGFSQIYGPTMTVGQVIASPPAGPTAPEPVTFLLTGLGLVGLGLVRRNRQPRS